MIIGPWILVNAVGLVFLFCLSAFYIGKSLHPSVGLAYFFSLASGMATFAEILYGLNGNSVETVLYMRFLSAGAIAIVALLFISIEKIDHQKWLKYVGYLSALNACIVLLQWSAGATPDYRAGMLLNASMNSSFIAITLPFIHPYFILPAVLAVFAPMATVPMLVFGVILLTYTAYNPKWFCVALPWVVAAFVYIWRNPSLSVDSGRYKQWWFKMSTWYHGVNHWYGSGAGTYYKYGAEITLMRGGASHQLWSFAHNEFIQCLFEGGFLSVASIMVMVAFALYHCRHRSGLMASFMGCLCMSLFNMPLRYVPTAFFGALLIKAAFSPGSRNENIT